MIAFVIDYEFVMSRVSKYFEIIAPTTIFKFNFKDLKPGSDEIGGCKLIYNDEVLFSWGFPDSVHCGETFVDSFLVAENVVNILPFSSGVELHYGVHRLKDKPERFKPFDQSGFYKRAWRRSSLAIGVVFTISLLLLLSLSRRKPQTGNTKPT